MATTVTVATIRQVDESARVRVDYPADTYISSDPDQLDVQDQIKVGAGITRTLWSKLSADTITDDWELLYVEARGSQLTLQITALDAADANPRQIRLPLLPGLPFMVGSRLAWEITDTTAYYVSQIDVIEELSATSASVAFTIVR